VAGDMDHQQAKTHGTAKPGPKTGQQPGPDPLIPPRPGTPPPAWARALSGAIVGVLAGGLLCAMVAAITLVLMLIAPGLTAATLWRSAATVMVLTLVSTTLHGVFRGVRRRDGESA